MSDSADFIILLAIAILLVITVIIILDHITNWFLKKKFKKK